MGKILIIKGADFSTNAVDTMDIEPSWTSLDFTIVENEGGIDSRRGDSGSASAKYASTGYVNLTEYAGGKLKYKNIGSLNNDSYKGMAFYNSSKVYISGVRGLTDDSIYTETVIDIPSNAAYARFTCWLPSLGYDDFEASARTI